MLAETDSEEELPPDWSEKVTKDNKILFVNSKSRQNQYHHPQSGHFKQLAKELPYGWVKRICVITGEDIYYNARMNKTSKIDPRLIFPIIEQSEGRVRFDSSTTAQQVLQGMDLTGLHVLVTGANSGIGFETARSLANTGATVIMACRNSIKGKRAFDKIKEENSDARIFLMMIDLCCLASVRRFCKSYMEYFKRLDVLVVNAGVFWSEFVVTVDGFESIFQTNYLSHYYLISQLSQLILNSAPNKIIFLIPESYKWTDVDNDNICKSMLTASNKDDFNYLVSYNTSKMALVLLCVNLHLHWSNNGVRCIMVHPGNMVSTNLYKEPLHLYLISLLTSPFAKSPEQGAAVVVYAAVSKEMKKKSGVYLNNFLEIPFKYNEDTIDSLNILSQQFVNSAVSLRQDIIS